MKSVYLAGPISGLTYDESTDWRQEVSKKLWDASIKPLSPMRGKEFLKDKPVISGSYENELLGSAAWINNRDFNDVRTSDALLVNFLGSQKVSIGTVLEIGAAKMLNKLIVIVMEPDNVHSHVMLNYGHVIVNDLDTGVKAIVNLIG